MLKFEGISANILIIIIMLIKKSALAFFANTDHFGS